MHVWTESDKAGSIEQPANRLPGAVTGHKDPIAKGKRSQGLTEHFGQGQYQLALELRGPSSTRVIHRVSPTRHHPLGCEDSALILRQLPSEGR